MLRATQRLAISRQTLLMQMQKLGQYTLLEKIAQGGMAQVYKAKTVDPSGIERLVVIKRILPHISSNPEYVKMLIDEAKIAVYFTHGNIAQVYDLGRIGEDYFIVMEYVEGRTFSQIAKQLAARGEKIPLDILLYGFIELCHGLNYIHKKRGPDGRALGVVHRDISPQNIILTVTGQIKIIDFGVAKADIKEEKTESGVLKGKFAYMSPEQASSESIDFRSDIFSVAILLWEMCCGERLFKRKTNPETIRAVQKAKYEPLHTHRSDVPPDLEDILRRALQRKPKHRFADAEEMSLALEKILLTLRPDFKPVYAAEYLSRIFKDTPGAELPRDILPEGIAAPDSSKKQPPVPSRVHKSTDDITHKTHSQSLPDEDEEPTHRDLVSHHTPVLDLETPRLRPSLLWMSLAVALIFIVGTFFAYRSYNLQHQGILNFEGLEEGMEITINEKNLSPPPQQVRLRAGKPYKIRIHRDQFVDYVQVVQLKPGEEKWLHVSLSQIKQTSGDLTILSTPPGATVYIDGMEWRSKTPVTIRHLDAGKKYVIGLYLDKYRFETREVKITGGKETRVDNILEVNYASLDIKSTPAGAQVRFNGKDVGDTPFVSSLIMPDAEINLEVAKPGFKSYTAILSLSAGAKKSMDVVLEADAPRPQDL